MKNPFAPLLTSRCKMGVKSFSPNWLLSGPVNERYRSDWSVRAIEPVASVAQRPVCGRRDRADERRVGPGRGPVRPPGSSWRAVPLPPPTDGRGDAVLGADGLPVALPA